LVKPVAGAIGAGRPLSRLIAWLWALDRAACLEIALIVLGLNHMLALPSFLAGDGLERFEALDDLLARGHVSPTAYSMVGPLLSAPLWALGKLSGSAAAGCLLYNRVVFTAGLLALYALMFDVAAPIRRRFVLLLLFASMFLQHVQFYYGEVFSAVWASVGLLVVARGRAALGWTCVALAVVNSPACCSKRGCAADTPSIPVTATALPPNTGRRPSCPIRRSPVSPIRFSSDCCRSCSRLARDWHGSRRG
jgi:hypothetical protein